MKKLEELEWLSPPYEIVELEAGKTTKLCFEDYEIGKMTISPDWPGAPEEKTIPAIRLHARPGAKRYFPYYWDLTPGRLVHQLAGLLTRGIPPDKCLAIYRTSTGPAAHFAVEWVEAPG